MENRRTRGKFRYQPRLFMTLALRSARYLILIEGTLPYSRTFLHTLGLLLQSVHEGKRRRSDMEI